MCVQPCQGSCNKAGEELPGRRRGSASTCRGHHQTILFTLVAIASVMHIESSSTLFYTALLGSHEDLPCLHLSKIQCTFVYFVIAVAFLGILHWINKYTKLNKISTRLNMPCTQPITPLSLSSTHSVVTLVLQRLMHYWRLHQASPLQNYPTSLVLCRHLLDTEGYRYHFWVSPKNWEPKCAGYES